MIGTKAIAILIALGVGLLAVLGGIYLYQRGGGLPFGGQESAATGDGSAKAPAPSESQAVAPAETVPAETTPTVHAEGTGGVGTEAEPTTVPSFDVVMIEPNGEGVIAGRAAPAWEVSVQSSGTKVAAATADAQGEWSAVLDKPLPAGDHALTLKITSPDGTRALSSQELVRVEVGDGTKPAAPAGEATASAQQALPQAAAPLAPAPAGEAAASPNQGQPLALAEPQGEARALPRGAEGAVPQPAKPRLVFKTVDYQDTGSAIGSVSITGWSDPGATIAVYCDNEKLATVRAGADGTWSVVAEKKLGTGQHNFRAERIDAATGTPSAQAMVAIERLVPRPPEVAAKEATPKPAGAATGSTSSAIQTAQKEVYTIRRGDTLWAIAKRYLGSGLRYTAIFQDNREVINDPDLILPQQQVKVPTP
jgi:nucleoid-associated protein YgaU